MAAWYDALLRDVTAPPRDHPVYISVTRVTWHQLLLQEQHCGQETWTQQRLDVDCYSRCGSTRQPRRYRFSSRWFLVGISSGWCRAHFFLSLFSWTDPFLFCSPYALFPLNPLLPRHLSLYLVGGVAQWVGRLSLAGELSPICAWSMGDMWPLCG